MKLLVVSNNLKYSVVPLVKYCWR